MASSSVKMDEKRFWKIITDACGSDPNACDKWDEALTEMLSRLKPNEIIEWNHIFDRLAAKAYTVALWGAAYTINGGASDDGFYYFRCWLIGMGQKVYEAALENPDSLASVKLEPGVDAEAEIYAAAHQAWMQVTGKSDENDYPAREESSGNPKGKDWDFDDDEQVRKRLPRLAAIYLDDDTRR
jgi:hypothetical protein